MDHIFNDIDFVFVYIDDLLVASSDDKTHTEHLNVVLDRLDKFGLAVNTQKREFGKDEINFLGHKVSKNGIKPTNDKIISIKNYERPVTNKELSRFLGMINFYHRFIQNASEILKPLYDAMHYDTKSLTWTAEMNNAFQLIKSKLCDATLLKFPTPNSHLLPTHPT